MKFGVTPSEYLRFETLHVLSILTRSVHKRFCPDFNSLVNDGIQSPVISPAGRKASP